MTRALTLGAVVGTACFAAVLAGAACGGSSRHTTDASDAPDVAIDNGPCAAHTFSFDSLDGVSFEPSTALTVDHPTTTLAPVDGGARSQALALPVKFGPLDYIVKVNLSVCIPSPASNLLDKHFSARIYLDGAPFGKDMDVSLWVWPQLSGADVPLVMKPTGDWLTYSGVIAPMTAPERPEYQTVGTVALSLIYAGTATWTGTIWIDDVKISTTP